MSKFQKSKLWRKTFVCLFDCLFVCLFVFVCLFGVFTPKDLLGIPGKVAILFSKWFYKNVTYCESKIHAKSFNRFIFVFVVPKGVFGQTYFLLRKIQIEHFPSVKTG